MMGTKGNGCHAAKRAKAAATEEQFSPSKSSAAPSTLGRKAARSKS